MRTALWIFLSLLINTSVCSADMKAETIGQARMKTPQGSWFMVQSAAGATYIFDAQTGDMHGLLSTSWYTPAVQANLRRSEIYAAETYYSRQYRGDRTDVLTIYDMETLSAVAEVKIPNKVAALPFRRYVSLMDNGKHLGVFNMTPAQSVSIVDIGKRKFVDEISTPGCALVMPVAGNSFMQICGDGTLQLIALDRKGLEKERTRSDVFFSIDEDPVFDKPVPLANGWLLLSFAGKVFEATNSGGTIEISEPWSIVNEEDVEEKWRPGGGQLIAQHQDLGLIFILMHQGKPDTHEDPGSEIWVFDQRQKRRISRIELESNGTNLHVSQTGDPLLTMTGVDHQLHVFDVRTTRLERSINEAGGFLRMIQGFDD